MSKKYEELIPEMIKHQKEVHFFILFLETSKSDLYQQFINYFKFQSLL